MWLDMDYGVVLGSSRSSVSARVQQVYREFTEGERYEIKSVKVFARISPIKS